LEKCAFLKDLAPHVQEGCGLWVTRLKSLNLALSLF
jgi:hypothetical protein